ncbi:MAG TPA: glucosaminidase domain-containing protein [Hyphomicrobiales bacterium]|nr:glucosaminidase domain-containing protein [Hyphomicrobiales bacterium]
MQASKHRHLGRLTHGVVLSLLLLLGQRLDLRPQYWPVQPLPATMPPIEEALPLPGVPDFGSIEDIAAKKQAFFDFLQPYIDAENERLRRLRMQLVLIAARLENGVEPSLAEQFFLRELSDTYEVAGDDPMSHETLRMLLRRVDVIPSSLVLAQAANESGWGTSRFAQEGFNFFGQWCYTAGCGLVPQRRRASAYHEVKSFDSVEAAVAAYFRNLNTFPGYQRFRMIRQDLRLRSQPIDGITLSEGLHKYSERGDAYIKDLRSMIYHNDLLARDY